MHRVVPVALALLVVLAGCSAPTSQQPQNNSSGTSPTATEETVMPTPTATPSTTPVQSATATPSTTTTQTTTPSATAATGRNETTVSGNLPSATVVKTRTIAAIGAVDSYRMVVNRTIRLSGNLNRTVTRVSTGVFNRDTHKAHVTMTQSVLGRTITSERYLVNGTLYIHSQRYIRQYGSAWVTLDVSSNMSSLFSLFDRLSRHRAILRLSTVTLNGTETINGTTTYRLEVSPNASMLERGAALMYQRPILNITNVSATYWINTETMRPIRVVFEYTGTMTIRGRPVGIHQRIRIRFSDYGEPVSITLPPAAKTAVPIAGNTTISRNTTTGTETTTETTTQTG